MSNHSAGPSHEAPSWEALARYRAGESPAGEARVVAIWLAAHPQDAELLDSLDDATEHALQDALAGAAPLIDVEAALRAVKARRAAEGGQVLPLTPRTRSRHEPPSLGSHLPARRRRVWWVAGGLAAAAALTLLVRGDATDRPAGPAVTAVLAPDGDETRVARPGQVLETEIGVRDSLRLPDGTRVVLAPGSRLAVAETFGRDSREVTLEGQAHFTATHDAARPFTVRTRAALVRDLGTVFTVRTDGVRAAAGVAVAVTEGRVALHAGTTAGAGARDTGLVLAAGDRGEVAAGGAPVAERGVVTAEDVAWATRGALVYRAAPVPLVVADLRRWYGIELRVIDPTLMTRRLTASFAGESAEQVLKVVALALGAEVVREGDVATLRAVDGLRR